MVVAGQRTSLQTEKVVHSAITKLFKVGPQTSANLADRNGGTHLQLNHSQLGYNATLDLQTGKVLHSWGVGSASQGREGSGDQVPLRGTSLI